MTPSNIVIRPVWYHPKGGAASYPDVASGQAQHKRAPDAWGYYLIMEDGRLSHLYDSPVEALSRRHPMGGNPTITTTGTGSIVPKSNPI